MSHFNQQLKPHRSKDIVFQSMPPDTVLLNLETGYYYSTNRLGALVWERSDGETTISSLIETLHQQFNVGLEQLEKDVQSFINEMLQEGLMMVDEHG